MNDGSYPMQMSTAAPIIDIIEREGQQADVRNQLMAYLEDQRSRFESQRKNYKNLIELSEDIKSLDDRIDRFEAGYGYDYDCIKPLYVSVTTAIVVILVIITFVLNIRGVSWSGLALLLLMLFLPVFKHFAKKSVDRNRSIVGGNLWQKKYDKEEKRDSIFMEIYEDYMASDQIIPFKYANPTALEALTAIVSQGRVGSLKEAYNVLEGDRFRASMSAGVQSLMTSQKRLEQLMIETRDASYEARDAARWAASEAAWTRWSM